MVRGGAGKGQGRKPTHAHMKRYKASFLRLPGWLIKWLKEQPDSSGEIVEKAVIEFYGLTPPEDKEDENQEKPQESESTLEKPRRKSGATKKNKAGTPGYDS